MRGQKNNDYHLTPKNFRRSLEDNRYTEFNIAEELMSLRTKQQQQTFTILRGKGNNLKPMGNETKQNPQLS